MKKIKYLTCRMRSCSNRVIQLQLKNVNFNKICDELYFALCEYQET
jgi:hypothetical protein